MSWTPTEHFLRGKIIKPFLPFEKHPNLLNDHLRNLYPGDEVYIFETKGTRWARGYVCLKPFPNDFTITSVNLDELPGININVVVFPLKYVKVIEQLPIVNITVDQQFNNVHRTNGDVVPTIQDSEIAHRQALGTADDLQRDPREMVPPLPLYKLDKGHDLIMEIKHTLELLMCHIFALYSIGEFRLFHKLLAIFYSLHETRVKLMNSLLTTNEIQVAKETATFLLNKIPKKLALRAARLNATLYDLDNLYTDISGYKAILARDAFLGELLSNANASPSRIAFNQVLCSLEPNFPINIHHNQQQYLLMPAPNRKLNHEPPSHILVDFKLVLGSSGYQPPGFAGMIAYLYIRNNRKRLTEAFAVHTNSVDELVQVEKILAALFRNIPSLEIENLRVYLVAVLTEEVDLSQKTQGVRLVRRVKKGVAAGVTDITRIFSRNQGALELGEAHQFTIRLFGSYMNHKKGHRNDDLALAGVINNGWGELVDRIIAGANHGVAVNPRAEKLVVLVKEFKHQFSAQLYNPVTLAPISRIKPIFFDPLAENYERIYLTMGKISLLKPSLKDDLLTFEVLTPNNDLITFAKALNQQEKRLWQFISVFPDEVIGEIVKVNGVSLKNPSKKLPKEDYIVLELFVNGVLAGEGKLLYKLGNRLVEFNKKKTHTIDIVSVTTKLPMAQLELLTEYIGKIYNLAVLIDHIFQIERFFKVGQKGVDELLNSLVAFCKLDISQLVKYFPELLLLLYLIVDILNAQPPLPLIEILQDNAFKAIVHLLDTVFGKQDQYLYLMDTFTHRYTNLPPLGVFLLTKISEIFSRAELNWNLMCRLMCRILLLLLKLAIHSVDPSVSDKFMKALGLLFKLAAFFLLIQLNALINDQIMILEIIDYVLMFRAHLDELKIFRFIVNFIDLIGTRGLGANEDVYNMKKPQGVQKDHKIVILKLMLIHRLFNTLVAELAETRLELVAKSVTWAMQVLLGPTDIEATRLACSVLSAVCSLLWDTVFEKGLTDEIDLCYSLLKLLPALLRTFIKYNKFTRGNDYFKLRRTFTHIFPTEYPFKEVLIDPIVNDEVLVEVLVEICTVFCFIAKIGKATAGNEGFSKILNTKITNDFFLPDQYLAHDFQNEDIITLISGVKLMRQGKFFPEDKWLTLYAMIAEGLLTALELVRPLLIHYYVPAIEELEMFDRVLWGNYLKTLLRLGTLAPVSIEHLLSVPKKAAFQITGTMRDRIAYLVNEAWDALAWDATNEDILRFNLNKFGGYQVEFINHDYGILQDLMLFLLQRNFECQSVGVKILWLIVISEYILLDTVVDIEKECLVGLHDIYYRNAYKPSKLEQERFIERMKVTICLDREDEAFGLVYKFIETLRGFMDVLNDLNAVPVGPEFDDDRTFHKLNIKAYLKNANKPELFHSFINSMYEEHLARNDYIQAALSLELLALTYQWDHNTIFPALFRPKFPEQTAFERKETLYKLIANNYIKGNSLERATDTYNELLDAYNKHTYDLKLFAYVHNKLAKLYLDLELMDKLLPLFFRVAFIGAGFPTNIRGKEQIYEGLPFEHITLIHERLLRLYPGARIVLDDEEARRLRERIQTGRYLHVQTVEPVAEISDKLFNTSIGVRQYARNKDLRFFTTNRKIPGLSSVFDLWTEETTYETYLSFPTLMNRLEIKKTTVVKLLPLDNAIRTVVSKNNDLVQVELMINIAFKEKTDYTSLMNDLLRHLAGTVDSPVNGGVGQYRTFFSDAKYNSKEEYAAKIRILRLAFNDLTIILNRCLHLHGKLVPLTMKGSHEVLVELYRKNFKEDIEALKISTDYENLIYNHTTPHFQPQTLMMSDKRSVLGMLSSNNTTGGSGPLIPGSLIPGSISGPLLPGNHAPGSRLIRTQLTTSLASLALGVSGLSFDKSSSGVDQLSMGTGLTKKRTALNWRLMVN